MGAVLTAPVLLTSTAVPHRGAGHNEGAHACYDASPSF